MRVDEQNAHGLRNELTDALANTANVIYYPDDSWGRPSLPEAFRIADFVVDFLLNGGDDGDDED